VSAESNTARALTVASIVVFIQLLIGAAAVTLFGWVGFTVCALAYLLIRCLATLWRNRV
jgi:hypothetical protein